MKRFFIVITPVFAAFLFFSFLSRTDIKTDKRINVFVEKGMKKSDLTAYYIKKIIEKKGYISFFDFFDVKELNHYLLSNPQAIFVTDKIISSNLFFLKCVPFYKVAIVATKKGGSISGITFNELSLLTREVQMCKGKNHEVNTDDFIIIDLKDLSLSLRPISVDGVFPSVSNIKNNKYPGAIKALIYYPKDVEEEFSPIVEILKNEEIDITNNLFSFIAGGDIMLARGTASSIKAFGAEYPFQKIRDEIVKHDIAFANLESPISNKGVKFYPDKGIYFRADPISVEGLAFCGFDVVSLANNHALDWGSPALEETMILLKQKGIKYTGAGISREEALKPAVFNIGDTSIAFLCYNTIYPFSATYGEKTMVTLSYRESIIKDEIRKLKNKYDVVIIGIHAGEEYLTIPEEEKVRKFKKLVDSGADIVIGSHPHVIQPIELYKNSLIAYSLGNLIFDQNWSENTSMGLLIEMGFLGSKPIYFNPIHVWIENTQANILNNEKTFLLKGSGDKGGKYHEAKR